MLTILWLLLLVVALVALAYTRTRGAAWAATVAAFLGASWAAALLPAWLNLALTAGALHAPLLHAFSATPVFNAVILGVFAIGVMANLRQVLRLQREVDWIESWGDRAGGRTENGHAAGAGHVLSKDAA